MKAHALLTSVFSKASILQILLYYLSHFSSTVSRLSISAPPPRRLSHLSAQITLSSLLCQNWQIIFHPNPVNQQWHFLQYGLIFLFQELPVTPLQSLPFAAVIPPCSLGMSQVVPQELPLSPELVQPSPALCPFFWQISLQLPFTFPSKFNNPVLAILSLNCTGPGYLSIVCSFFSQINRVKG